VPGPPSTLALKRGPAGAALDSRQDRSESVFPRPRSSAQNIYATLKKLGEGGRRGKVQRRPGSGLPFPAGVGVGVVVRVVVGACERGRG
jgi:hypothetical protein